MKALAAERGVADHFTFYGRASDDVLLDVLNTADICVNPDRASDMNDKSTMNKIMEYMALGKPIVQFDLHEGRQSAGGASLYAKRDDTEDFAKKICQLIVQKSKRDRMGALGRERIATRLSWEHSAPALLRAYERVYEKDGQGSARRPSPPRPPPDRELRRLPSERAAHQRHRSAFQPDGISGPVS